MSRNQRVYRKILADITDQVIDFWAFKAILEASRVGSRFVLTIRSEVGPSRAAWPECAPLIQQLIERIRAERDWGPRTLPVRSL